MPLRMRVHDREPIGAALRRFKKLLERSGVTKELRKRKYYEKPCEARRRAKLRKLSAIRKAKTLDLNGAPRRPASRAGG
jgi:small subunit ribosomal protein S21